MDDIVYIIEILMYIQIYDATNEIKVPISIIAEFKTKFAAKGCSVIQQWRHESIFADIATAFQTAPRKQG